MALKIGLKNLLGSVDQGELTAAQGSPEMLRRLLYGAIDRVPVRWGTWGKFAFGLLVRPALRRTVNGWIRRNAGG